MADEPQGTHPAKNWRYGLAVGLSIGLGIGTAREAENALEPSLGHWGAVLVGILAAVLVAGLVSVLVSWLLGRGGRERDGGKLGRRLLTARRPRGTMTRVSCVIGSRPGWTPARPADRPRRRDREITDGEGNAGSAGPPPSPSNTKETWISGHSSGGP
jgi:hypothetical protein